MGVRSALRRAGAGGVIAVAAIALMSSGAGCGDDDDSQQPDSEETTAGTDGDDGGETAEAGGSGDYVFEDPASGAIITYSVLAPEGDATVAQLEAFRVAVDAPGASYVTVTIDNTDGTESADLPDLAVESSAGMGSTYFYYDEAWLFLRGWQNLVPTENSDLHNQGVDLYNSLLELGSALPGASTTTVLAAHGTPADIATVFIEGPGEETVLHRS
jgi:hypothetical protein